MNLDAKPFAQIAAEEGIPVQLAAGVLGELTDQFGHDQIKEPTESWLQVYIRPDAEGLVRERLHACVCTHADSPILCEEAGCDAEDCPDIHIDPTCPVHGTPSPVL